MYDLGNGPPKPVLAREDVRFHTDALPFIVDDEGRIMSLGTQSDGEPVFTDSRRAYSYMVVLAKRDLQYRGMRDDRVTSFLLKQDANFLLYQKVLNCEDHHEFELLRQSWDVINRPKHRNHDWGPKQLEALAAIDQGISYEDEESKRASWRYLYIPGPPGSGKSALLLEAGIRACKHVGVLIVCPTGINVYNFKAQLPDVQGIENIRVDTIQGVLKYKRGGKDANVKCRVGNERCSLCSVFVFGFQKI